MCDLSEMIRRSSQTFNIMFLWLNIEPINYIFSTRTSKLDPTHVVHDWFLGCIVLNLFLFFHDFFFPHSNDL